MIFFHDWNISQGEEPGIYRWHSGEAVAAALMQGVQSGENEGKQWRRYALIQCSCLMVKKGKTGQEKEILSVKDTWQSKDIKDFSQYLEEKKKAWKSLKESNKYCRKDKH